MTDKKTPGGTLFAILAAALYAISTPFSKLLLQEIPPVLLAGILYLGAALGMIGLELIPKKHAPSNREARLAKSELPYIFSMIALDIAAPIFLLIGLSTAEPANVALLNNFEIVATSLLAYLFFRESISKKLGIAIVLVTIASMLLSVEDATSFHFSFGSLLVLLACICWGLENNCTRKLSVKDPRQIVIIKGLGSGGASLCIGLVIGERVAHVNAIAGALCLGFVAYGLSIFFYIHAQRSLGAAKTSAYYSIAPFIGVLFSILLFRTLPGTTFVLALFIMIAGSVLASTEWHGHDHVHPPLEHEHSHTHEDGHHTHHHLESVVGVHSHFHTHDRLEHSHEHEQDVHHTHSHKHK